MVVELGYFTKVIKRIGIIAISVVVLILLFKLSVFYMPFLVAFIIALTLEHPIKFFMNKFGFKRRTSSIIIFLIAISIITGLLVWGISTLVSEASNLMQGLNTYIDKAYTQIENISSQFDIKRLHLPEQVEKVIETSNDDFFNNITTWVKNSLSKLLDFLMQIPTIAIYTSITLVALYFMCVDKVYMIDEMEHHLPAKWVKKLGSHIHEIISSVGNYLKAECYFFNRILCIKYYRNKNKLSVINSLRNCICRCTTNFRLWNDNATLGSNKCSRWKYRTCSRSFSIMGNNVCCKTVFRT